MLEARARRGGCCTAWPAQGGVAAAQLGCTQHNWLLATRSQLHAAPLGGLPECHGALCRLPTSPLAAGHRPQAQACPKRAQHALAARRPPQGPPRCPPTHPQPKRARQAVLPSALPSCPLELAAPPKRACLKRAQQVSLPVFLPPDHPGRARRLLPLQAGRCPPPKGAAAAAAATRGPPARAAPAAATRARPPRAAPPAARAAAPAAPPAAAPAARAAPAPAPRPAAARAPGSPPALPATLQAP